MASEMTEAMREVQQRYMEKHPELVRQLSKPAVVFMCMLWELEDKENDFNCENNQEEIKETIEFDDEEIIIIDDLAS